MAQTFTFEDKDGVSLSQVSRLDTMITIVDTANFLRDYNAAEELKDRDELLGEDDHRTVTHLLIDQIEFADIIVLNKLDLVGNSHALEVETIVKVLNPGVKIFMTMHAKVPLELVFDTSLFDYEKAASSAGWIRELQSEHKPETEEYGISSFTYHTSQPFNATKLWAYLHNDDNWRGVLRSKGFFWVAADHRVAYEWAQAGGIRNVNPMGMWWAAVPREHWEHPEGQRPDWHPRFGDCAQKLVFISQHMNEAKMRARLDACLLDQHLADADSNAWEGFQNPFPELMNRHDRHQHACSDETSAKHPE